MLVEFDEAFVRAELERKLGSDDDHKPGDDELSIERVMEALREILRPAPRMFTCTPEQSLTMQTTGLCACPIDWTDGCRYCQQCGLERRSETDAL